MYRERYSSDDDDSSTHSPKLPPVRDKRNRPLKALVPKRPVLDRELPSIQNGHQPSTVHRLTKTGSIRRIPSLKQNGTAFKLTEEETEKQKENVIPGDNPSKKEKEETNPGVPVASHRKMKSQLCSYLQSNEFGSDLTFKGPFGTNFITYLDYTASARPLKCFESYIQRYVLPTYANTHTEVSHNAIQTTAFREEARDIIRRSVNAGEDDCIIFTGSGVTSGINKLVHCLQLDQFERVIVFIGPYEHHSNILPWLHSEAEVIRIPQNKEGMVDVKLLAKKLEEVCKPQKGLSRPFVIGSFSAASNVTGIRTPTYPISTLMHKYDGVVFWDYACAGPYVNIDMNPPTATPGSSDEPYKDAVFISPHKFVGGPGTPGILVAKRWLFRNPVPHDVGGGTVLFVSRYHHVYISNPEQREEGGTPSIIESIRCGLVFKLKDSLTADYIMKREFSTYKNAVEFLKEVDGLVLLGNLNVHRLPIFSCLFYNGYAGRFVHHDFIATIFNDVFGIQVRSGCACAGPYGLDLLGMSEEIAEKFEKVIISSKEGKFSTATTKEYVLQNTMYKPGFVRFNLPYYISEKTMDFTLKAVKMVSLHGWSMLPQYRYDSEKSRWLLREKQLVTQTRHLGDISFASGSMKVHEPKLDPHGNDSMYSSSSGSMESIDKAVERTDKTEKDYSQILKRAQGLFYDALSGLYDCADDNDRPKGALAEDLRWFMTPKEAADILHKRIQRPKLDPANLPFMPGALALKLGINPAGHRGRGKEMDKDFIMEYFP